MKSMRNACISTLFGLGALLGAAAVDQAAASVLRYQNVGARADSHLFFATQTGELSAFFFGSTAAYEETLGLAVNGVVQAHSLLDDKSSAKGTEVNLGKVNKGDVLTFFIDVKTTGDRYYSQSTMNQDGVNHTYSTSYDGGDKGIPAGTFIAFEDMNGGGDLNYNDETFVLTNTSAVAGVPLPGSAPMFGAALLALGTVGYGLRRARPAATA